MMDFIMVPAIFLIISAGIYGLFELFVRKQERLKIIEKISDKFDGSVFEGKFNLPDYGYKISFSALKIGCMFIGIGLGLLIGFFIVYFMRIGSNQEKSIIYGSSVLLFGGIGLIVAFLIELRLSKKNKPKE